MNILLIEDEVRVADFIARGLRAERMTVTEAKTGTVVWQERLGGLFMPSPLFGAGKLYFCNEEGDTAIVRAADSATRTTGCA